MSTHWEMWMFVQGGMTPFEALRSGTLHGAKYLGLDKDIGTIKKGKLADLIVIEKGQDPTTHIQASEKIHLVIANGRVFDSKTMNEVGPNPQKRKPFYWEKTRNGIGTTIPAYIGCQGCGAH